LRVGGIIVSGTVRAGADPLGAGFEVVLDTGAPYAVALRPLDSANGPAPAVLGIEMIEHLAEMPDELRELTPQDRLLRALLDAREGDAAAAKVVFYSGPLPPSEPLVADLEKRMSAALEELQEARGERRKLAEESLHLVRRESQGATDGDALAKRIERLLADFGDALKDDELKELRRMRDERLPKASAADLGVADVFKPSTLVELPGNRIRLHYDFSSGQRASAFDPGNWVQDVNGWAALSEAQSDADMLKREAPTLALRDPLRIDKDPIDIRLRFEPIGGSPAELLLVSCAGFQCVFTGARNGAKPRLFVDTGEPVDAVLRARESKGELFAGWNRKGEPVEIHLVLYRAGGRATVEVDGKRVGIEFQKVTPKGDPALAVLSVRSWERLRLLSVVIEATRR
jgi:hypothetical protein